MGEPLSLADEAYEHPVVDDVGLALVDTFNFTTYDARNRLGGVLCLNRLPGTRETWRHGVMVYHPSGDLLVGKGYATVAEDAAGFGTANLHYGCEEPFQRWVLRFDGFVQRAAPHELRDAVISDRAETPMRFELTFDATVPAWGHVLDAATGFHYEQNGLVTGSWRCGDKRYEYSGVGFRDRILGPKDTSQMLGHNWFNGLLPNGDAFFLTSSRMKSQPEITQGSACVFVDGKQYAADLVDVPTWDQLGQDPHPFSITLSSAVGEHRIGLEPIQSSPWCYVSSDHLTLQPTLFGHARTQVGALLLWESAARVTWGDRVGHGHVEQSLANLG